MSTVTQINKEKNTAVNILCDALNIARATYYRQQERENIQASKLQVQPQNALTEDERKLILDLLRSERFVDKTVYDVFYTLLDEGTYHCSPRTMYRLLTAGEENKNRRRQRSHSDAIKPELIATRPNEVWSWDITKLYSEQKLTYYYLYVIIDIFSRYVVGWLISDCESKELASQLIESSAVKQNIRHGQLTLHADNGASMTSHTVAQLLNDLGITKTHNRPYTSNDNPFSESQFKTMKYCPDFPGRFESLLAAEAFGCKFFNYYNKDHYHSGIVWVTPEAAHYGYADVMLKKRHATLMRAYDENPIRFNNKAPTLKILPPAVYINQPQIVSISALQAEVAMT